ncbi:hypothetical protein LJR290_007636 [Variovorax sp. LjRoot290]
MRIVSWNCARGPLDRKLTALHSLHPDIAVVCETPAPPDPSDRVLWFPTEEGQSKLGIQVRSYGPYRIERLSRAAGLPACVNPVRVSGPTAFNLLAVWTWPAPTYLGAIANGIETYAELFAEGPTVVAGDFNGNPIHDKPFARAKWADTFTRINDLGSVSAYHHARQVDYGGELDPTHHFLRNPERPFHIDFCFVPQTWCNEGITASVEWGEPWNSIGDHFPVVVDLSVPLG